MRVLTVTAVTLVSLAFIALAFAPVAVGLHCTSKVSAYGRSTLSPQPAPPYSMTTSNICISRTDGTPADGSTFPPGVEQVFVRIDGDFGPSVLTVRVEFTGLGFDHSSITLNRTQSLVNGFSYDMREWIFVPQPGLGGDLSVTAFYPSSTHVITYHVMAKPSL